MQATSWRKSSRSSDSGPDQNCVECRVTWRKSSRSSNSGPDQNCVEARSFEGQFQVRDSKLGHDSPVFALDAAEFATLLRATTARLPKHEQAAPGLMAGSRCHPSCILRRRSPTASWTACVRRSSGPNTRSKSRVSSSNMAKAFCKSPARARHEARLLSALSVAGLSGPNTLRQSVTRLSYSATASEISPASARQVARLCRMRSVLGWSGPSTRK